MIQEETRCKLPQLGPLKQLYTKKGQPEISWFQTSFASKKGEISLIHLGFCEVYENYRWEIYCNKGELFEDCERFGTLIEAVERIKELLEEKQK